MSYKKGDLVYWNDLSGEGFVFEEKGLGIVVEYSKTGMYRIFRIKYGDYAYYMKYEIEEVKQT